MTQPCSIDSLAKGGILVAEDDSIVQLALKKILEQAGYEVDFAADGNDAISALELRDYDLVLMDCMMPQMDGFATTRYIRSAKSMKINPRIPIIALTGLSTNDDHDRCRDAGMNNCVHKPIDSRALITAIKQCTDKTTDPGSLTKQNGVSETNFWNDEFLDTIIDTFLTEMPQLITGLQQAEKRGDVSKLQQLGHRLRGAADILGVPTLSNRSNALEQAGKAGDRKRASKLTLELIVELRKLNTVLTV